MLEFIVLGRIPGTHIQLTFGEVLQASLLFIVSALIVIELRRLRTRHANLLDTDTTSIAL